MIGLALGISAVLGSLGAILRFGGGTNDVQRTLIALRDLHLPR